MAGSAESLPIGLFRSLNVRPLQSSNQLVQPHSWDRPPMYEPFKKPKKEAADMTYTPSVKRTLPAPDTPVAECTHTFSPRKAASRFVLEDDDEWDDGGNINFRTFSSPIPAPPHAAPPRGFLPQAGMMQRSRGVSPQQRLKNY